MERLKLAEMIPVRVGVGKNSKSAAAANKNYAVAQQPIRTNKAN
jgi:hypothetical protein